MIENADELLALYERYGVLVNLSGHIHCQHIVKGRVCDIATSSLAVSPCQYGVLTLEGSTLTYETSPVDVSAWAAAQGRTEPELMNFSEYAQEFFLYSGRSPFDGDTPEDEALSRFFGELNLKYFAGRLDLVDPDDPMFDRWENTFGFEGQYIMAIRDEAGIDSAHLRILF